MSTNIPVCEMDLAATTIWMDIDWRWSRTGSLCGTGHNWRDTTLVSPLRRDGSARFVL